MNKLDLASLFPAKGDDRRPPDWLSRALIYVVIAAFVALFVWFAWASIAFIVYDVVISMFIALSIEPLVMRLIRHGWKRSVASAMSLIGLIVVIIVLLVLFGNMFVQQAVSMASGLPDLYQQLSEFVLRTLHFRMPNIEQLGMEILKNVKTSWVVDFAGQALSTTAGLLTALLNLLTVVMVTYYISAAGPAMRRCMCKWLSPNSQRRFVFIWSVVQEQISSFLFSRTLLATINAIGTAVFLVIMNVPYWLPLSLFCGIVSQFVPTVGTYLGGALPIVFAWGANGFGTALATLAFVTVYQQIENMVISPKISEKTMDLNPAVAFLSVLVLGAVFGALGAFLALPVTASLQAIFKVYTKHYDLIDSPLMNDPKPEHKSMMVTSVEALGTHVVRPVKDQVERVLRGSSSRVSLNEDVVYWYRQAYVGARNDAEQQTHGLADGESEGLQNGSGRLQMQHADDDLATVSIDRALLDKLNHRSEPKELLLKEDNAHSNGDEKEKSDESVKIDQNAQHSLSNKVTNRTANTVNPRSRWRNA